MPLRWIKTSKNALVLEPLCQRPRDTLLTPLRQQGRQMPGAGPEQPLLFASSTPRAPPAEEPRGPDAAHGRAASPPPQNAQPLRSSEPVADAPRDRQDAMNRRPSHRPLGNGRPGPTRSAQAAVCAALQRSAAGGRSGGPARRLGGPAPGKRGYAVGQNQDSGGLSCIQMSKISTSIFRPYLALRDYKSYFFPRRKASKIRKQSQGFITIYSIGVSPRM